MSIDEKINEALGISNDKPVTKAVVKKEYTPPVPRVEDKNKEDATKSGSLFISALEKANKTNIVHKNKISRKKSRCAELLSTL